MTRSWNSCCAIREALRALTAHPFNGTLRQTARDLPWRLPFPGVEPYRQLKAATEVFVMLNCGVPFGSFMTTDGNGHRSSAPPSNGPRHGKRQRRAAGREQKVRPPAITPRTSRMPGTSCSQTDVRGQAGLDPHPTDLVPGPGTGQPSRRPGHVQRHPTFSASGRSSLSGGRHLYRHPAGEADESLLPRADLELLAGGGRAGPDDERDHLEVPEPPGTRRAGIRWHRWRSTHCGR